MTFVLLCFFFFGYMASTAALGSCTQRGPLFLRPWACARRSLSGRPGRPGASCSSWSPDGDRARLGISIFFTSRSYGNHAGSAIRYYGNCRSEAPAQCAGAVIDRAALSEMDPETSIPAKYPWSPGLSWPSLQAGAPVSGTPKP